MFASGFFSLYLTFINLALEEQPLVIIGTILFEAISTEADETFNYRMTTLELKH